VSTIRCLTLVSFLALLAAMPAGARPKLPKPPSTEALIDQAKAAVRDGTADPARDLAPILERLRTSREESDQRAVIRAIEDLGRYDGANPAAVKEYLREGAPPVLLEVARSKADGLVRCSALMALRDLNASDEVLDEAVALTLADASSDQKAIKFRGRLLADWKETRGRIGASPAPASTTSAAKEQAALNLLRRRDERVSVYTLSQAAEHADAELVTALLDAGIDVNADLLGGMRALDFATSPGCVFEKGSLAARLATIDLLFQRGADAKRQDTRGNTILMGALECPPQVVEKLIAAGASVTAANSQGFTPLAFAFAKGRWDLAAVLVAHGGRLSQQAIDKLFFEKPTEPEKLALIKRATTPTAANKSEDSHASDPFRPAPAHRRTGRAGRPARFRSGAEDPSHEPPGRARVHQGG
jgi:hypothetical protein